MRKGWIFYFLLMASLLVACGNDDDKTADEDTSPKSMVDSLEDLVWDGHDVGMVKMGKLRSMKLKAEQMIDSISKLPAGDKEAAGPFREQLHVLVEELGNAKEGMDKWMRDYRNTKDSAIDDPQLRIRFLRDEVERVNKVRDDILNSLAKADSLIR